MKKARSRVLAMAVIAATVSLVSCSGKSESEALVIESWRNDDITFWEDVIIPTFNKSYPDIEVVFSPTAPAEYNSALNAKLEGGTAGDLLSARPFDASLDMYKKGQLESLNDLPGMNSFSDTAKVAWRTDDGSVVYAVPMASVIHGFMYNVDIFNELGLEEPATEDEFYAVLDAILADGRYVPMSMGTSDLWEAATMGFQNIGPNYWKGEEGRLGLLDGTEKFSDQQYVDVWAQLANWGKYMSDGFQVQSYSDSQTLFTLGKAAIYPTGSWEIGVFEKDADFEMGAFPPPAKNAGDTLYISDHTDIAMALNAASDNKENARVFLEWMTTKEFADLYSNALPGFFSLSNHSLTLTNSLAQEFVSWRDIAESTIRNSYQIINRGEPNLENQLWQVSASVINGDMTPQEAGDTVQAGLDSWYTP